MTLISLDRPIKRWKLAVQRLRLVSNCHVSVCSRPLPENHVHCLSRLCASMPQRASAGSFRSVSVRRMRVISRLSTAWDSLSRKDAARGTTRVGGSMAATFAKLRESDSAP